MTRPFKVDIDEEMHVCPTCNQNAQYYFIIGPDGMGLGTSYAMCGKDDAEEMVDMLNDAYESGEADTELRLRTQANPGTAK